MIQNEESQIPEDAETPAPKTSDTDRIGDPPLQTSSTKPGQLSGKKKSIGKGGYQETVAKIERENKVLLKKFDKIETLLDRFSASPAGGDLTSFVDRGLGTEKEMAGFNRDEIARTWESGKKTFEELIAEYERLRGQKIWSQEDLEGILNRMESLAQGIADSVRAQQTILSESKFSQTDKDPKHLAEEQITGLSASLSNLGERIVESRDAILEAIANRTTDSGPDRILEFDPNVLSPLLRKIGDIEELVKQNRATPSLEADRSIGTAGRTETGIRQSLFTKQDPEKNKLTGKTVVTPRIKRLGFVGLMAVLAIVAVVARVKHSGPTPEMANPIATRNTLPPPLIPSPIEKRSYEEPPKFQSIEPVLSGLDKLREGVNENGQAIADLSGKIDRALTSLPNGTSLSIPEKRLIDEGRELEWLVKTWPAGPGRKELLRMMGNYAGE